MDAKDFPEWAVTEKRINLLFRILTCSRQTEHCKAARTSEVNRAIKTLIRNGDISPKAETKEN